MFCCKDSRLYSHATITDCGEAFLLRSGGIILFDGENTSDLPQFYDCVWTVKRHISNYPDGLLLRLDDVSLGEGIYKVLTYNIDTCSLLLYLKTLSLLITHTFTYFHILHFAFIKFALMQPHFLGHSNFITRHATVLVQYLKRD